MKVVIAPNTFKESLPASEAAAAIAEGILSVLPHATLDLCPMADGGDGTVPAMVAATGGRLVTADVFGPLGEFRRAHFGLLGTSLASPLPGELGLAAAQGAASGEGDSLEHAGVAVIEMAAASGLALTPTDRRDPLRTTTFGTGQLILAALEAGAREIIIGIGGSATVDGGCGCAQALGVTFMLTGGEAAVCGLAGGSVGDIERIDLGGRDPRLASVRIRVACDVTNPLTGPDGAAAVYGPQKGATPEMVTQLEANLVHLAAIIRRDLGVDVERLPGAGAAGGLGAGLVAFLGAKLERGTAVIAEAVRLGKRLEGADLCITGEGKLDRSSAFGKAAVEIASLARQRGVPTICLPGQVEPDAPVDAFVAVHPLVDKDINPKQAIRRARELLKIRAAEAIKHYIAGK